VNGIAAVIFCRLVLASSSWALADSTLQRMDPASGGRTLETCLVTLPPSGGTERHPDPAVSCCF
jgi:hypothetical protein